MPSVQDVLDRAPAKDIDLFLEMLRTAQGDSDRCALAELIVRRGLSARQAAKAHAASGSAKRSVYQLYEHAKNLVEELYRFLGQDHGKLLDELFKFGEVEVPSDQLGKIRAGAKEMGYEIEEVTVVRIVGKRGRETFEQNLAAGRSTNTDTAA